MKKNIGVFFERFKIFKCMVNIYFIIMFICYYNWCFLIRVVLLIRYFRKIFVFKKVDNNIINKYF